MVLVELYAVKTMYSPHGVKDEQPWKGPHAYAQSDAHRHAYKWKQQKQR
jgi:hypothetical protein